MSIIWMLAACTVTEPPFEEPMPPVDSGSDTGSVGGRAEVTVTPSPGSANLPPRVEVIVMVDGILDPASVDTAVVTLVNDVGIALPVDVSLEGDGQVVVDPVLALELGRTFTVSIGGLALEDGIDLPEVSTSFSTHPPLEWVDQYDIYRGFVLRTVEEGRLLDQTYSDNQGPDNVYGTADDVVSSAHRYVYDDLGRRVELQRISDPGADLTWLTSDDLRYEVVFSVHDGPTTTARTVGGGIDGVVGTQDDVVELVTETTSDGRLSRWISANDPGADGTWLTWDDGALTLGSTELDEFGNPAVTYALGGPGDDRILFSSDDPVTRRLEYERDPLGRLRRQSQASAPGADGVWGTGDDVLTRVVEWGFDELGRPTHERDVRGAGPDGVWGTDDDSVSRFYVFETAPDGIVTRSVRMRDPGVDGEWGTTDDLVSRYEEFEVDTDGFVVSFRTVELAGSDGLWFTDDDDVEVVRNYETPRAPVAP